MICSRLLDINMKPMVVLSDLVDPSGIIERELLEPLVDVQLCTSEEPQKLRECLRKAAAVITCTTRFDEAMIDQMIHCKVIVRTGVGVDNIPLAYAKAKGIYVCNVPNYCTDEVADHTFALILSLLRKIVVTANATRAGKWYGSETLTPLPRLRGLTIGMLGFGRIAQEVARRALAFNLRLIVFDPFVSDEVIKGAQGVRVELMELYRNADIISVHLPLTQETRYLIGEKALSEMKPTAFLINTSRGALIDWAALLRALETRQIAGAALDVLEHEPPVNFREFQRDDLIITPHMAYFSDQAFADLRSQSVEEVLRVLRGEGPRHPVFPLDITHQPHIQPVQ